MDASPKLRARSLGSKIRDFGILGAMLILIVVLSLTTDSFLSVRNLLNILEQWSPIGIMAVAGTLIIIAGGFDLSVGAAFALSGVVTAVVAQNVSPPVGVLAGIACGVLLGLINGLLSTVGRMNVFVVTLGTSIVYAGLGAAVTGGAVQVVTDPAFGFALQEIFGVNAMIWVFLVVVVILTWVLTRTNLGRYLMAVGGKEEAARLAGVRVTRVHIMVFLISGALIGIAAVLFASRSLSVNAVSMNAVAFNVWTAMLLGGNSIKGGEGAIWRTVVGVMLLALIGNGFDLLGIAPLYQQVVTGVILLGAIALDTWTRRAR
ncbi:MAG TPA: ABC transporter permease [Pseudolysinimonas sp.]|nr:ABC transporter permease [Pseudolysinimonas sp.]